MSDIRQRKAASQTPEKTPTSPPSTPVKKSDETLLSKILIRFVAGMTMVTLFWLTLQLPHRAFAGFIVLLQILTWHEVVSVRYNQVKEAQLPGFRTINWYFLFVTFFFFYSKPAMTFLVATNFHPVVTQYARYIYDNYKVIMFSLYLVGFLAFILSLRGGKTLRYQMGQISWTLLCLALIVGQTNFSISYLLEGYVWILLPHGLIIFNDVMAYFFGISFGRRFIDRPLTSLSPNKTWEGFIGAMISTVVCAFYVAPLFRHSLWLSCPADQYNHGCVLNPVFVPTTYHIPSGWHMQFTELGINAPTEITLYPIQVHAVFFALFAAGIAPFGGFLASGIKRAFNKKDYHNIIPGHGGFMDRFDCQLLMSTFVYIYFTTFIKVSSVAPSANINNLMSQISVLGKDDQFRLLQQLNELVNN